MIRRGIVVPEYEEVEEAKEPEKLKEQEETKQPEETPAPVEPLVSPKEETPSALQ
jgi:hypothetical protein